ncbi:universal stress protein [Thiohalomonas denitrificans]|uniref:Universal stress protein n=1 Tax=Thiohalomonas denitrificans TaxID=415747 RepID=A0A1G5R3K8_9GAMM|nr:universal stress protein [Thiohalomonas denitrificans]SCZ68438.1 universal stress protein A [Thiohalomonas denitrificans]
MSGYRKILLAVDFTDEADRVCERALSLANLYDAELYLVHVIEPLIIDPAYDILPALPAGFEKELADNARERLREIGHRLGIPENRQAVKLGSTKAGIIGQAEELGCDLIVLGSHGRHGPALLLGSTANAVLHSASCDVLAVRIHDQSGE